jgi:hypothetical protein
MSGPAVRFGLQGERSVCAIAMSQRNEPPVLEVGSGRKAQLQRGHLPSGAAPWPDAAVAPFAMTRINAEKTCSHDLTGSQVRRE